MSFEQKENINVTRNTDVAPELSVIIPVYNSSPWLRECLDSALKIGCSKEIIVVNDGSTDDSLTILEDYANNNENFVIIDQPNGGLSNARNNGIRIASGIYLFFLDSDDYIDPEALQYVVETAGKEQADLALFDAEPFVDGVTDDNVANRFSAEKDYLQRNGTYIGVKTGLDMFEAMWRDDYIATAWGRIQKREWVLQNDLFFTEGIIYEDEMNTFASMILAERCMYVDKIVYMRRVHADSIMTSSESIKNLRSHFVTFLEMASYLYDQKERIGQYKAPGGQAIRIWNSLQWDYHQLMQNNRLIAEIPFDQYMIDYLEYADFTHAKTLQECKLREEKIYNSTSYRLGNAIVKYPHKIRTMLQVFRTGGFHEVMRLFKGKMSKRKSSRF